MQTMIISQTVGLEQSDVHKPSYFGETMPSPLSLTTSIPNVGQNTLSGASQGLYAPSDAYYIPGRVQPDLASMNMYTSQPETLAISSPGNYVPNPANITATPGLISSHYPTSGLQHPPGYPPLGDEYEMRSAVGGVWHGGYGQTPPSYYPYDNTFNHQYPYDRHFGMDINDGVRRKNATRESTNTLKAWLQEHKKNPYPTKGEKIMLAIITKMTLTQVSTWFANARRRLKKENKMTWVPKNRSSDSNNNSSKKIEDDDDDLSQHSHDNECKSDIEHSIDSDDSDTRKVTSTNSNDEITTTSDFKQLSDFAKDQCSITSESARMQDVSNYPGQPSESNIQSDFDSFDRKEKSWPTPQDNVERKPSPEMMRSTLVGVNSQFPNDSYGAPSGTLRESTALRPPSIKKTEETLIANDNKYPDREWDTSAYQYASTNRESQGTLNERTEEAGTLQSRSPAIDENNSKSTVFRNNFLMNSKTEPCATSPVISSSFLHGYTEQQPPFLHSFDYYRHMERHNVDTALYYPQMDLNGQTDLKQEQVQGAFSVSGNKLQPKSALISSLSTSSLPTADSLPSSHLYQPQHLSPTCYSNMKLNKPNDQPSVPYGTGFYQHDNFHHVQTNSSPSNPEFYQRKNFYTPEASNYHSPAGSPRK